MDKIIENIIKEYEEIKTINNCEIEKINNENIMIDSFIRDLKLIKKRNSKEIQLNIYDILGGFKNE